VVVGVVDEDSEVASVGGFGGEEVGHAGASEDRDERVAEELDPAGRVAHQQFPVGRGEITRGGVGDEHVARLGHGRTRRWGGCDLRPEVVFGGVERAGDFAALAGVWGATGQPAPDGPDVHSDDLRQVVGPQPGSLERCAKVLVGHWLRLDRAATGLVCRGKECSDQDVRRCPRDILRDVPSCPCDVRGVCRILVSVTYALPQIRSAEFVAPARVGLTRDQVMTASEVAELLQMPVSTVYHLARRGELPACRLGRTWRFLRPRLEEMLGA
jgi:excisionase family DNA binding protein